MSNRIVPITLIRLNHLLLSVALDCHSYPLESDSSSFFSITDDRAFASFSFLSNLPLFESFPDLSVLLLNARPSHSNGLCIRNSPRHFPLVSSWQYHHCLLFQVLSFRRSSSFGRLCIQSGFGSLASGDDPVFSL